MRSPPDGLDVSSVIDALRDGWDFEVDVAEYAAVGAGSYHWHVADTTGRRGFVTVDDLGQKAWLGDTHDESFDGLRAAFDTAVALRESGLRFVVAPFPTREGASLLRLDPRYAIALFPSVDGTSGEWGRFGSDADRLGVVADARRASPGNPRSRLHGARDGVRSPGPSTHRASARGAERGVDGRSALGACAERP